MFKIGAFTSGNNPRCRSVQVTPSIDTWTSAVARTSTQSPNTRVPACLLTAAGVVGDCVTDLPRRICDRLFTINDTEAYWRGWQIVKTFGGLGRRYRTPDFDTLARCTECRGTGIEATEIPEIVMPCDGCLGSGRMTLARVDAG